MLNLNRPSLSTEFGAASGEWVAVDSGRVIQILSITGGLADLDLDGSGQPADASALAALGITDAERQELASLYLPGQSLWRAAISHFSIWDLNWGVFPPLDVIFPPDPLVEIPLLDKPCPV